MPSAAMAAYGGDREAAMSWSIPHSHIPRSPISSYVGPQHVHGWPRVRSLLRILFDGTEIRQRQVPFGGYVQPAPRGRDNT
ncbi:hypothetical protein ACFVMC_27420 [Nocardia sp. NPDC127579]|uniref:hypothetical protein n=1 Tax=Nocardia sp. NPDC127579 TaxID=3345402 RepID=UPI0036265396